MENSDFNQKPSKMLSNMDMVGFSLQFGFFIAIPLFIAVFLGKFLNNKYHTHYWVYILGFLALITSIGFIYRKISNFKNRL